MSIHFPDEQYHFNPSLPFVSITSTAQPLLPTAKELLLLLAIAQLHNSIFAAPSPFTGTAVSAAVFCVAEAFVFALGQPDYDVGFAGS
jgi:hypothetical protein